VIGSTGFALDETWLQERAGRAFDRCYDPTGVSRQAAAVAVAAVALLLVPIVAVVMKNRPEDVGLRPYGASVAYTPPRPGGNPIRVSLNGLRLGARSGSFWLLAGSFFVCGASTNGLIGTHLIPAAMDHGMAEVTAASLLALVGFFDIIGTIFSGWLTDRWNSRGLLCWYYALRGLSLFVLPFALRSLGVSLIIFIVFYGLDWVATVPPTAALAVQIFAPIGACWAASIAASTPTTTRLPP